MTNGYIYGIIESWKRGKPESQNSNERSDIMKKLKIYKVYMEDASSGSLYSTFVPAENEKKASEYCSGNGECVTVKNADDYKIHLETLAETLASNRWGRAEIEIITRTLELAGVSQ